MPLSPYAQSKLIIEEILKSISSSSNKWRVGILRYFNPIGSHKSGIIGENTYQEAGNLIPSIIKVILKESPYLNVFGADYNTSDGTGVRDYLHIDDLLDGHLKALNFLESNEGFHIWNLGRGKGYSDLEVISAFEELLGDKVPYKIQDRRRGDLSKYWAEVLKAKEELNWKAKIDIKGMVKDTLRYVNKIKDL